MLTDSFKVLRRLLRHDFPHAKAMLLLTPLYAISYVGSRHEGMAAAYRIRHTKIASVSFGSRWRASEWTLKRSSAAQLVPTQCIAWNTSLRVVSRQVLSISRDADPSGSSLWKKSFQDLIEISLDADWLQISSPKGDAYTWTDKSLSRLHQQGCHLL